MTLRDEEKLVFFEGMYDLMSSGIPITEALSGFEEDAPKKLRLILKQLRENIQNGKTMHESLALYPQIFDEVTLTLVETGEQSGNMDTIFESISKNLSENIAFKTKIKNALVYPAVLSFIFVVMLVFIMVYAVPKFKYVFSKLTTEIPLPTKVVFAVSDTILKYHVFLGAGVVALVLFVIYLLKRYRREVTQFMAILPVTGSLYNNMDIYRFTKTMSLLIASGIPITTALGLCKKTVYKNVNLRRLREMYDYAESGKEISGYLNTQKGLMPKTMINLIEFGEKSGSLDRSFSKIASTAQIKVQSSLDRIAVLMEPLIISFMGVVVGAVMMSIIAPIYQLIGNINAR